VTAGRSKAYRPNRFRPLPSSGAIYPKNIQLTCIADQKDIGLVEAELLAGGERTARRRESSGPYRCRPLPVAAVVDPTDIQLAVCSHVKHIGLIQTYLLRHRQ